MLYPVIDQRCACRLQQLGFGHGPAIVAAHQELDQLPRRLGLARAGKDGKTIRRCQRDAPCGPCGKRRHADAEIRLFQNVAQSPGPLLYHGQVAADEGIPRVSRFPTSSRLAITRSSHIRVRSHSMAVSASGFAIQLRDGVLGIDKVAIPAIDMHLDTLPAHVKHAAPEVGCPAATAESLMRCIASR